MPVLDPVELRRLAENGVALGPAFTYWPDPEVIVELLDMLVAKDVKIKELRTSIASLSEALELWSMHNKDT